MTSLLVLLVTAFGSALIIGFGFWAERWLRKNYPYLVGASPLSPPANKTKIVLRPKNPQRPK